MAQHDLNIANQSFPSFRTDLNNALSAIQTTHSGTSRPTGAVAGQIWLDTTTATSPTLKYYDGADDISLATIDHSANTVNWLDSTVSITGLSTTATGTVLTLSDTNLNSTVSIRIPTTKGIDDDSGNEFLKFTKTATAVNEFTIINSATGSAPEIQSTGDDTDIDLKITPKGAGKIILDGLAFPNADGTASQVLQTNGSGVLSFSTISASGKFESALLHVRDEKASGTEGGTFTLGAWRTRDLNTSVTNEISGASLSSNQITLPAGTFYIIAKSESHKVNFNKLRLINITDSSTLLIGMNGMEWNSSDSVGHNFLDGRFTIASTKTLELQHISNVTKATDGFGRANSLDSTAEVYTDVQIWKVA